MTQLGDLQQLLADAGQVAFLVFLRIGSAMALLPGYGERSVPARIRLMLAFAFTAIVAPSVAPGLTAAVALPGAFPKLWLSESILGIMLGLSLRLTVLVLHMAGTIIAQSISLAQVFASAGTEPVTVVGELLVLGGITLAMVLGLHIELTRCLIDSYRDFSPGDLPAAGDALEWLTNRISGAFALSFSLAMPFVIGALVYNVALGVINKAMPQLMVAMVGAPALTLGGLALLMLAAPVLLKVWISHLGDIVARPF